METRAGFAIKTSTDGGARTSDATYVLVPTPGSDGSTVCQSGAADLDEVRAQQKLVSGWENADPKGTSGSIGVELEGCEVGNGPRPDATLSIALRTGPDGGFSPLVKRAPWKDVLGYTKLEELGPC